MDTSSITQNDLIFFLIVLTIALASLAVTKRLLKVPFPFFFMGVIGATAGLYVGDLIGRFLDDLPGLYGRWLPIIVEVFVGVAVFDLFLAQAQPAARFLATFFSREEGKLSRSSDIIVDTSALIDGRIEEVVQTGFVSGRLIVPRFVLSELQNIADAEDTLKRARGRRGLEVLSDLQSNRHVIVEIVDGLDGDKGEVDSRLVKLAKDRSGRILTVDYNLSRVAQIQGIGTLNLHELASALKPILLPGEDITVKVIQKGKEKRQGVGYLDDGTMVVVEGGDKYVGAEVECEVVRIFQTVAGKMIFVQPKKS